MTIATPQPDPSKSSLVRGLELVWRGLISLQLAVILIVSLAVSLATATIMESKYDTPTAQYLVYQSKWFFVLLSALGLNILAVAISRWPWKKAHTPFLMAHAGILMILVGSWLTSTQGLDGSVRLSEDEVSSAVELDQHMLVFKRGEKMDTIPLPWRPAFVAENFKEQDFTDYDVKVTKYVSDAEPKIQFVEPGPDVTAKDHVSPAIQLRILGSPMGGTPELWLWSGDAGWATQKLGPARFLIRKESDPVIPSSESEARLDFVVDKNGILHYEATSIRGEKKSGPIDLSSKDSHPIVNPGWRMPIQVEVKKFVASAVNKTEYVPIKFKPVGMGSAMPNPAIQVALMHNPKSSLWLGLGDRAEFIDDHGETVTIGYFPKRVILPFALRLQKFEMKHNPGTQDPASYASFIQVVDGLQKNEAAMNALETHEISMNEPLKVEHYTFYQASFIPDFPRPTTTILSVNYDPGRFLKYTGSLLLVFGIISLYLKKFIQKKRQDKLNPESSESLA
jgi:hypothetical protein